MALWCDNGDIVSIGCQQEEGDTPSANIDAVIQIDATTYKEQTPWIRNTASGNLFPDNKEGITVENGLIKAWDMDYASGTMFPDNNKGVTIKNGLITGWNLQGVSGTLSLISGLSWNGNGITKVERCNITIKSGMITGWNITSQNY